MTNPDLLRRAAAQLRQHAEATTPYPWSIENWSHGWDDGQTWRINGPTGEDATTPCVVETKTDDAGFFSQAEADVEYVALMHPPVALALADWLDQAAEEVAIAGVMGGFQPRSLAGAVATAKAVLREPEETPEVLHTSPHCACGINDAGHRFVDPICRRSAP